MFKKYMTAGIVGSALLASAAFAQTPSTTTTTTTSPAATAPVAAPVAASDATYTGNWRTSKVVGLNVYNEANESLGSINDLLTDKEGNIKGVVIGVGGFLGVGERLIAVSFDKIKFVNEPVATTAASAGGSTGMKSGTASSGMTTGAATSGAAPAAATPAKPNPWYPDHAMLSGASKDQLKAMPEFKYAM